MRTEPEVLRVIGDAGRAAIKLRLPEDLIYWRGHFPGLPLLPGVVQVGWALTLARGHLKVVGEPLRISALKFRSVLAPGSHVQLNLELVSAGQLRFEYRDPLRLYSSGCLHLS